MVVLLFAALVGGLLSFIVLWPSGVLTALLGAQLGATFLVLLMCPVLALRRRVWGIDRSTQIGSSKERDGPNRQTRPQSSRSFSGGAAQPSGTGLAE
jgi:hypothetical protein